MAKPQDKKSKQMSIVNRWTILTAALIICAVVVAYFLILKTNPIDAKETITTLGDGNSYYLFCGPSQVAERRYFVAGDFVRCYISLYAVKPPGPFPTEIKLVQGEVYGPAQNTSFNFIDVPWDAHIYRWGTTFGLHEQVTVPGDYKIMILIAPVNETSAIRPSIMPNGWLQTNITAYSRQDLNQLEINKLLVVVGILAALVAIPQAVKAFRDLCQNE